MYAKVIYKTDNTYQVAIYENIQNILSTADGISIELPNNKHAVYLHKELHSVEIRQEKPEY